MMLYDLTNDLMTIPMDQFEIFNFGSNGNDFIVIFQLQFCEPYQTREQFSFEDLQQLSTTALFNDKVFSQQDDIITQHITNFQQQFRELSTITTTLSPKAKIDQPTFNYINLYQMQLLRQPPTTSIGRCGSQLQCGSSESSTGFNRLDDDMDSFESGNGILSFSPLQSDAPSSVNNTMSKYYYQHPTFVSGPSADSNGGFYAMGVVVDPIACSQQQQSVQTCSLPEVASAMPSERVITKPKSSKSLSSNAIIGIIVGIIALIIFIICVIMCCTWVKQIWCFKDYRINREKEKKSRRSNRTTLGTTNNKTTNKTAADPSGKNTKTTQKTPATQRNTELQQFPQDFDSDFDSQTALASVNGKNQQSQGNQVVAGVGVGDKTGLPVGWNKVTVNGQDIYINEETMMSSRVAPNIDGTLPNGVGLSGASAAEMGW
jgi:hypothetical protein